MIFGIDHNPDTKPIQMIHKAIHTFLLASLVTPTFSEKLFEEGFKRVFRASPGLKKRLKDLHGSIQLLTVEEMVVLADGFDYSNRINDVCEGSIPDNPLS